MSYYIGTLSGTSLDGIDIALVQFNGSQPEVIKSTTIKYPLEFKNTLRETIRDKQVSFEALGTLEQRIAKLTADGIKQILQLTNTDPHTVNAIGLHGQTLFHIPGQYSLQIGDPNLVAYLTGIKVVSDFRRMDIAAGGQGAPLTPLIHQALFHSYEHDTLVINLGGIANMTVLNKEKPHQYHGYDIGPANTLLDTWCEKYHNKPFDKDGRWASEGKLIKPLLDSMLQDPYFTEPHPKSTGPEYFNLDWVQSHMEGTHSAQDVQTTLTELTALILADAAKREFHTGRVLLCGGGCHNMHLVNRITRHLHDFQVMPSNEVGVDCDSLEAVFFAWLARKRLKNEPLRLEQITGSQTPICLGGVYLG